MINNIITSFYSPYVIGSYIKFIYADFDFLTKNNSNLFSECFNIYCTSDNRIPIAFDIKSYYICVIMFNEEKNEWVLYHNIEYINVNNKYNIQYLEKDNIYIGLLLNNFEIIEIIQKINIKNNTTVNITSVMSLYNIGKDSIINQNTYNISEKESNNDLKSKFKDVLFLNSNGGVILVNSTLLIDIICYFLKVFNIGSTINNNKYNNYYQCIYPIIMYFKNGLDIILNNFPIKKYGTIYKKIIENDKKYFDKRIKIFNNKIIKIFELIKRSDMNELNNFFLRFICQLRKEICLEISNVYNRLRFYPNEREVIYKKFKYHPYIKIIKLIHQTHVKKSMKEFIVFSKIESILFDPFTSDSFNIYNEKTVLLLNAMKLRSVLFEPFYDIYLNISCNNINLKNKRRKCYYPFKIFSVSLFLLEHILNINFK